MHKVINLSFVILVGFFFTNLHAKTLSLNPNETKLLANNTLWTLNATCNIQGKTKPNSKIKISVLKNKGTVNGKNLTTGQATSVPVKTNSNISVSAEAGTQINLVNLSNESLQATCSQI